MNCIFIFIKILFMHSLSSLELKYIASMLFPLEAAGLRSVFKKFRDCIPMPSVLSAHSLRDVGMYFDPTFLYFRNVTEFLQSGMIGEKIAFDDYNDIIWIDPYDAPKEWSGVKVIVARSFSGMYTFENGDDMLFPGLECFNMIKKERQISASYIFETLSITPPDALLSNGERDFNSAVFDCLLERLDIFDKFYDLYSDKLTHVSILHNVPREPPHMFPRLFPNLIRLNISIPTSSRRINGVDGFDYQLLNELSRLRILQAAAKPKNMADFILYINSSKLETLWVDFHVNRNERENRVEEHIKSKTLTRFRIDSKPIGIAKLGKRCPRIFYS